MPRRILLFSVVIILLVLVGPVNAATNRNTQATLSCFGFDLRYDFVVDRNNTGNPAAERILFIGRDAAGRIIFSREQSFRLNSAHVRGHIESFWTAVPKVSPLTL